MPKKTCKRRASGRWFNCFSNTGAVKTPSPRRKTRSRSPRRKTRSRSPRRKTRSRSPRTRQVSPNTVTRRLVNLADRERNLTVLYALEKKMKHATPSEKQKLRKLRTILLKRISTTRNRYQ